MRHRFIAHLLSAAVLLAAGCAKHEHVHDKKKSHAGHAHTHNAKHGGVAVVLGEEEFHVEFTYGDQPGTLQAYVFDAHMEEYVRIAAPSFVATVKIGEATHAVVFHAVANAATGETIGDTALFEARPEWLTGHPELTLLVPTFTVKTRTYTDLTAPLGGPAKKTKDRAKDSQ